ncbi:hypothetical protein BAC2_00630 [uncultured bacterium]|nr:hypothetical protein BAC2_00630 [uncultured bacterium]
MSRSIEDELTKTSQARAAAWSKWGALDGDVITHLINPSFMGGPRWPAMRQAFRVARKDGAILIASDGLSDPFDDAAHEDAPAVNGLGLEVFGITQDAIDKVPGSWLFQLVWQAAQLCAGNGRVAALLDEVGTISTELYDVAIPESHAPRYLNQRGRVGVLLGLTPEGLPERIEGPLSSIRLVALHLLTLEELEMVVEKGTEGRKQLADRFAREGIAGTCTLGRPSFF